MESNVTLKLNDQLLKQARKVAVDEGQSLSGWVAGLVVENLQLRSDLPAVKRRALARMQKGFALQPGRFSREELHER